MSRLSLTQLATLRAFVRTGTLTPAADSLGYTPGAVSQHVSSLEKALGARLVQRSGRQLVLTEAGRVLSEYAERILTVEQEALHALASVEGRVAGPGRLTGRPMTSDIQPTSRGAPPWSLSDQE